jgi:hypothetical protein
VLGVAGTLDADVRRERRLVQASLAQHVESGGADEFG